MLQPVSHDINDHSGTASLKSVGLSLMLSIRSLIAEAIGGQTDGMDR